MAKDSTHAGPCTDPSASLGAARLDGPRLLPRAHFGVLPALRGTPAGTGASGGTGPVGVPVLPGARDVPRLRPRTSRVRLLGRGVGGRSRPGPLRRPLADRRPATTVGRRRLLADTHAGGAPGAAHDRRHGSSDLLLAPGRPLRCHTPAPNWGHRVTGPP